MTRVAGHQETKKKRFATRVPLLLVKQNIAVLRIRRTAERSCELLEDFGQAALQLRTAQVAGHDDAVRVDEDVIRNRVDVIHLAGLALPGGGIIP